MPPERIDGNVSGGGAGADQADIIRNHDLGAGEIGSAGEPDNITVLRNIYGWLNIGSGVSPTGIGRNIEAGQRNIAVNGGK